MGKSTRKQQEKIAKKELVIQTKLNAKSADRRPSAKVSGVDIMPTYVRMKRHKQIRDHKTWRFSGKSHRKDRQQIALIRHMFAKYPVPNYLEQVFISEDKDLFNTYADWYIAAAQGESLYKTCTRDVLSKKETHYVLQAPSDLTIQEAIWWAKSMALEEDRGVAYRMAKSPITIRGSHKTPFWVDVHRFFTLNPVSIKEMGELIDYIMAARVENANWTIKKRSLEAIRRSSEKWHRDMVKMGKIGGGTWIGMGIPAWTHYTGKYDPNPQKSTEIKWTIFEILTGNELAKEGNRMRHCVSGYKTRCMQGTTAIFSMRSETAMTKKRNLTIEVQTKCRDIVQFRGLANRYPLPNEQAVLEKWATKHNLRISRNSF